MTKDDFFAEQAKEKDYIRAHEIAYGCPGLVFHELIEGFQEKHKDSYVSLAHIKILRSRN